MKKWKQRIAKVLVFVMLVTLIPVGNATKVKVKKKEKYYKYIKYTYDSMDISSWKTYLEYNLKKFYVRN